MTADSSLKGNEPPATAAPPRSIAASTIAWPVPLLLLITLLVLGRVCFAQFTSWDDSFNISKNPAFLPPTASSMRHLWTAPTYWLYIPLTYTLWGVISWATQITNSAGQIIQLPWPFHTANLLVHLTCVVIVFRTLRLLKLTPFPCFCGALLFAIHPIQVEAVAWASGMRDLLATAFGFAAVEQYLLFASKLRTGGSQSHYIWATAAFVAAVLCKPTILTLPLCVGALDRWALRRPWRDVLPPAMSWMIVALPTAVLARLVQGAYTLQHTPLWARPFIAADTICFYLIKILAPFNLAVDYGHTPTAVLAAGQWRWNWIIPISLAIAALLGRRRAPLLLCAALFFLIGILPVLGLTEFLFQHASTTADHYLYCSMFGPALALGWLLCAHPTRVFHALAIVGLLACALLSFRQTGYWKNDERLWSHELAVNPRCAFAYFSLGMVSADRGDFAHAADAFGHAAQLDPVDDVARDDFANALHQAGRLEDAILAKRQTLDLERGISSLHANWARHTAELGAFLCEAGHYSEALPYLKTAHAIAPHDAKVTWLLHRATTSPSVGSSNSDGK